MTFGGLILGIAVTLGLLALLGEGVKSALRIDRWSDLWRKKVPEPENHTFRVDIKMKFTASDDKDKRG